MWGIWAHWSNISIRVWKSSGESGRGNRNPGIDPEFVEEPAGKLGHELPRPRGAGHQRFQHLQDDAVPVEAAFEDGPL